MSSNLNGTVSTAYEEDRSIAWLPWTGVGIAVLFCLIILSHYHFLLFHILVEFFSIVIAWAIFIVVWNTRDITGNKSLTFIGIVYLFVGFIDLLHTVSYKGMNIFFC